MFELKITQGTHIYIGLPCAGGVLNNYTHAGLMLLQKMCTMYGLQLTEDLHSGLTLIQIARNRIVRNFLESKATHLMFIDADIGFYGPDVLKLIAHDKDICCGVYPKKMIQWENIKQAIRLNPNISVEDLEHVSTEYAFRSYDNESTFTELTQIKFPSALPTGFMCIKRHVLEGMFDKMRAYSCYGQEHREFFHVDIEGSVEIKRGEELVNIPEHISEDFWFCYRAMEQGFELWLDPTINLIHTGPYSFSGSLVELAKLDKLDRENT